MTTATQERPLRLTQAAKLFDSNPSIQTLLRWIGTGVLGPDRQTRIRLRAITIGGRKFVEPSAARDFVAACSTSEPAPGPPQSGQSSKALESLGC